MFSNKVVVITGASAGIGAALARECSRQGAIVVLAARRRERLDALCAELTAQGGRAVALSTDVADEKQAARLVEEAVQRFGRIDVLVNNAGYGIFGRAEDISPEEFRRIFAVNLFGVHYACRAAIPVMRRQGSGHIINVSSVSGGVPLPFNSAYCGTKFALNAYSDALGMELRGDNIRVSVVAPGPVATEFLDAAVQKLRLRPGLQRHLLMQSPEKIARVIVGCIRRPRRRVYPSLLFWLYVRLYELFPWLMESLLRRGVRRAMFRD